MPRLVLLAVAVASLLVAPVATAPTCSGIEEDTTYDDFDIMQTSQSSMEGCCADCDDTPTCTAFTWEQHSTSMNGTCHLKSSSLKQSFRAGSRSAKLVARLEKPLCGTAGDATDTPGNAGGRDVGSDPGHKAAPAAPLVSTSAPTPTSAWTPLPSSTLTPPPAQTTSAPTPVVALPNSTLAAATDTLEPTPPPRQCSNMFYDIDLPGNNLVVLERNTAALCCATCSVTSGCKAFVWMLRGNIGTCMLKSAKGTPTHYPGAIASYPMKPAPVPTPSACPVVEYDVDYRGNDILSTYRSDFRDCCGDCKNTLGCTLYVWIPVGGGKCTLKNKKGAQIISSGARAGVLPHDPPINRTSNVTSGLYAANSLSPTAFNFISGAQWIDMTTMTAVNAQVEAFEVANRARNFSHASGPVHVPLPESVLNMKVYINVTSSGECAAMTSTRRQNFFTYWNDHMYCYVHMYTRATSLQMVTAADQAIVFPQDSDPAYISTVLTNVNTNADCVKACISKRNCAGVTYAGKTCTFYRPRPSQYPDVVAGWV
ncbi:hypothetical protein H310_05154 [Aphanomyces invadans]|uniref:Apple domain-containing protein n=1 Tax=Aphanomyces invadans TaxID=157072 RepID=A0A024UDS5_9STRA|nr:hypothetical protein H310_05154 [Aphanomyces invadans]ETW03788.1 hypothetical protein H310_05154 [Aphanomyces invadans]|eukprot:XP_008868017.1 hypothetical protein H310_05154 [Aphanomyces invadans]